MARDVLIRVGQTDRPHPADARRVARRVASVRILVPLSISTGSALAHALALSYAESPRPIRPATGCPSAC